MDYSHVAESIWAYANGNWYHDGAAGVPYVRKDLHAAEIARLRTALAEAEARSAALVARAWIAGRDAAAQTYWHGDWYRNPDALSAMKKTPPPTDATAALARMIAEAKAEGYARAVEDAAIICEALNDKRLSGASGDFIASLASQRIRALAQKEAGE